MTLRITIPDTFEEIFNVVTLEKKILEKVVLVNNEIFEEFSIVDKWSTHVSTAALV